MAASCLAIQARRWARTVGRRSGCASARVRTSWLSFQKLNRTASASSAVKAGKRRRMPTKSMVLAAAIQIAAANSTMAAEPMPGATVCVANASAQEQADGGEHGDEEQRLRRAAELVEVERAVGLLLQLGQVQDRELHLAVRGARQARRYVAAARNAIAPSRHQKA